MVTCNVVIKFASAVPAAYVYTSRTGTTAANNK